MATALSRFLFKKESPLIPDKAINEENEAGQALLKLRQLVNDKKFNEAENELFDMLDVKKQFYVAIGLDIYARMSLYSDEALEANGFSREEIVDGMKDMLKEYKINIKFGKPPKGTTGAKMPIQKPNVPFNVLADNSKK